MRFDARDPRPLDDDVHVLARCAAVEQPARVHGGPRGGRFGRPREPRNDLAILRAPGLGGAPALSLHVNARPGASAAVLGFPENGGYDVQPARLGQTGVVISQDAYGQGPVRRAITTLRGRVRHGNSGGPLVDGSGRVVATIFAAATGRTRTGYGVPDSIVRSALGRVRGQVDTGPCA